MLATRITAKDTGSGLDRPPAFVNFFQYPPLRAVGRHEADAWAQTVDLSTPLPECQVFTVFVSIPYCLGRCYSCSYFKAALPQSADRRMLLDEYLACVDIEACQYADTGRFALARCGAAYFGGGTASLLEADQVGHLVATLADSFHVGRDTEVTLEANPHQLTPEYLQQVRELGVNRLSIGFQSRNEHLLRAINSPHTAVEGLLGLELAMATPFRTVNVDLLYRLPGQTFQEWEEEVNSLIALGPQGITTYEYIIHPRTRAEHMLAAGSLPQPPDKDTAHNWYSWARDQLTDHGYVEHRKGSFARPGHEQQYGALSYDQGCESLGLGAGAYSFVDRFQFKTPDNPDAYRSLVGEDFFPAADRVSVRATDQHLMERYVIFSFFSSVLDRQAFGCRFGVDPLDVFPDAFSRLREGGLLDITARHIILAEAGVKQRNTVFYQFYAPEFRLGEFGAHIGSSR